MTEPDETCPHLCPIRVTLDLSEGDLTLRHTDCGLPVAADWPSLRAHKLPLTLVYAQDDADEDWLELRAAAEAEQPAAEQDGDVRAVAAVTTATAAMWSVPVGDHEHRQRLWSEALDRIDELHARFADRIAALGARDAKAGE